MTKPLCISQGLHDLLLSGRITGVNKNPLNASCMFNILLQAKPSTILTSRDSKEIQRAGSFAAQKTILGFILALGDSLCQSFLLFFFFSHKCCRLNFVPNNPDSVPAHFLDEPLSSIMTNYGAWWYVTGTSPPLRGCGGNKKTERNIPGPKRKKKLKEACGGGSKVHYR